VLAEEGVRVEGMEMDIIVLGDLGLCAGFLLNASVGRYDERVRRTMNEGSSHRLQASQARVFKATRLQRHS
jgi:hypothetical protein